MSLFTWLASVSPDDWDLLLYFFRILLPLITLCLWIKGSSLTDMFDRLTTAILAVVSALIGLCGRLPKEEPVPDSNGTKFHVTSKVELPRGQKISRRWLVSWKPVPENDDQATSSDNFSRVGLNGGPSNGGTKIVYFDPTTGMTFNVNTSIQSITGEILKDANQENSGEIQYCPTCENKVEYNSEKKATTLKRMNK